MLFGVESWTISIAMMKGMEAVEMWLWRCGCGDVAVEKDDEAPWDGEKAKRRRTRDRAREERADESR